MILKKGTSVRVVAIPTEEMYNLRLTTSKFLTLHLCAVLTEMLKAKLIVSYTDGSVGEVTARAKGSHFTEVRFGSNVMKLPSICLRPADGITFSVGENVRLSRRVTSDMNVKIKFKPEDYVQSIADAELRVGVDGSIGQVDWVFSDGFLSVVFPNGAKLHLPQDCFDQA